MGQNFILHDSIHTYEKSISTKEKLLKSPFKTISYSNISVIFSSIQSWNNTQQKPGSLKTLPSAKIKQLITDEILKNN